MFPHSLNSPQTISDGKTSAENARNTLISRREELEAVLPHFLAIGELETGDAALAAIDGALDAVSDIGHDFDRLRKQAEEKVGQSDGLLDALQAQYKESH